MDGLVIGFGITVLVSLIAGLRRSHDSSASLKNYFVGDHRMSQKEVTNLLMASSMSLNGLFYHSWLGYKVGVYSLLVQAFWAGSFLILARYRKQLVIRAQKESLFGNIESEFGTWASKIAVAAACITFIVLIGWEISIALSFTTIVFELDALSATAVALLVVFVAISYTSRGGIYGNAFANIVQNYMKTAAFVLIIVTAYLFVDTFAAATPESQRASIDYFKLSPVDAAIGLGGIAALLCNLFFSVLWQPADGSAWQIVSSGTDGAMQTDEVALKTLRIAGLKVLIFPGLAGTLLGMSLAGVPNLEDREIFSTLFATLKSLPFGEMYVGVFGILLTAAMLSTIDGLLLAASYTMSRDLLFRNEFDRLINLDSEYKKEREDNRIERRILSISKLLVLGAGLSSLGVYWLVHMGVVGLFEIVYLAVIGQMALAPLALEMIKSSSAIGLGARPYGWLGILIGMFFGYGFWVYGSFVSPMLYVSSESWLGGVPWIIAGPPAAFIVCALVNRITSKYFV